jgi:hypothetical protein
MTIREQHHSKDWMKRHRRTATMTIATNFGIPLTGSMATGFAVGFMKG